MKKTIPLTESGYIKLLKDIRVIIEEGRERAAQAAGKELVKTYWAIGKRICEQGLLEQAGYGESILEDLSDELDIDLTTLKRCIYFFQTYPSDPGGTNLNWSHYRALITLADNEERCFYESLTQNEKLTAKQLHKAIKEDKYEKHKKSKGKKTSNKTKIKRPDEPTYIYKALVDRVIDGDTLLLRFDLGFQVWKEQRIRLAEIDCPAMDEPKGKEAFQFVRDKLAQAPFVMVKTNKIDVYGRYIGHVFYSLKNLSKEDVFLKGIYLNQELLGRGLARIL